MRNDIHPHDVLCGRGGLTNSHVGNKRFRCVVAEYQIEYLHARKNDKKAIARKIIARIQESGGRFLKRCSESDMWVEITYTKALLKTSQALREGLDVRQKKIRGEKSLFRSSMRHNEKAEMKLEQTRSTNDSKSDSTEGTKLYQSNYVEVPDLIQDDSPTQSFEPIFTFLHSDGVSPSSDENQVYAFNIQHI